MSSGGIGRPTAPGLIIVLALVLIGGGCLAIVSRGDSTPPATPTSGATAPAGAAAAAAAPTVSIPPRAPNTPTFTDTLRVTDRGINIDQDRPKPPDPAVGGSYQIYVTALVGSGDNFEVDSEAAIWNDATTPNYDQCMALIDNDQLRDREREHIPYRHGLGVCMRTAQSLAFLRGESPDGTRDSFEMQTIRWERLGS